MSHRQLRVSFLTVVAFILFVGPGAVAQTPFISSLSPSSALAGGPGFVLTVNGSGFDSAAFVHWNGSNRPTTFVSSSQLTADISSIDILVQGTATIFVRNSPPFGPVSNTVSFLVTSQNPVPSISSLSPSSAVAGGPGFTLVLNGSGFVTNSVVRWNGSSRTTSVVSGNQLRAQIPSTDIATAGTAQVTVFNPTPGGGLSGAQTFTIGAGASPQLEILPGSLNFQGLAGGSNPASQTLRIGNSGGGSINWTAQVTTMSGGDWLSLSRPSGSATSSAPSLVDVSVRLTGLAARLYSGTITVQNTAGGSPMVVGVFLNVLPATPVLLVGQSGLTLVGVQGGDATPGQSFAVANVGQGTMNWVLETVYSGTSTVSTSWLTVTPNRGANTAGTQTVITASANPGSLAPGNYYAEVRIAASGSQNSPQTVTVVLNVLATGAVPGGQVSPLGLIFVATVGGSAPPAQPLILAGATSGLTAIVTATTTSGGTWLDADRNVDILPGGTSLPVRAGPGSLPPNIYLGELNIAFSDRTTQKVSVIFVVLAPPAANPAGHLQSFSGGSAAACVPSKLLAVTRVLGSGFASSVGWPRTIEVQAIDDCGNPAPNATVLATFSNSDPPLALVGLGNGIYSGTWKPGTSADTATVTIRVNLSPLTEAVLQVPGKISANPTAPQVGTGGVVNAASFAKGQPLSPGSIFSVFGSAMAGSTPGAAASLPLPVTLAGASLLVGGVTVPLYYSSAGQINAQIPVELAANSRPQVVVRLSLPGNNAITVPESIVLDTARPGIFLVDAQGQGVIIDLQGRVVNSAAPATAGDVLVVYATGLGATNPRAETGKASPGDPPGVVVVQPTVTIGGISAPVQFAGLTPGLVGLYQVNVQVPAGVTPGLEVPLVITQNGIASNSVKMAVR